MDDDDGFTHIDLLRAFLVDDDDDDDDGTFFWSIAFRFRLLPWSLWVDIPVRSL